MRHVVIVGAGPAGASLAHLLAHRGVQVSLLEARSDFTREFRGEVLMPSGVSALTEMGLHDLLSTVPSYAPQEIEIYLNKSRLLHLEGGEALFAGTPVLAVSQTALLEAIVQSAAQFPHFQFKRGTSVKKLIRQNNRVTGVIAHSRQESFEVKADLVIGADGRNSIVRRQLSPNANQLSPPMDIVWCKLPCPDNWTGVKAYAGSGHLLIAYHTWDGSLQLGWVILKGSFGQLKQRGIQQWIEEMASHVDDGFAAHLRLHAAAAQKPFLLESVSDCVQQWSEPGALLIGDAAHTMSPVGGQGINIALRDAIVSANHLVPLLNAESLTAEPFNPTRLDSALRDIEAERMPEIRHIQNMQAQPPRLALANAWWGEALRYALGRLLTCGFVQDRAASRLRPFLYGVSEVRLVV